ncbi:MAG: hypothetical protein OXR62_00005 [Ahrensia sp.]|nr:hypothetical protein [Ahrensia sp.]
MPMLSNFKRHAFAAGVLAAITTWSTTVFALDAVNPTGPDHLAIRGTDTTSYFTKRQPHVGAASHVVKWNGATWHFVSASEAAKFWANPEAYAPQFGAYCTGGLSQRHVVEGKPQYWRMHGNKLYLFHTSAGVKRFSKDPQGTIAKANAYWRELGME